MLYNIDWCLLNAIQLLRCTFLDYILSKLTIIGEGGLCWIIICIAMLFFKRTRKCGVTLAICLLLCLVLGNGILKPLIARPRPYMLNPDIITGVPLSDSYSFPSGHTYSSIGSAIVIWYHFKQKWGIPALLLALLISFSRIYFQMHFVTDVLGGILLGIITSVISIYLINMLYRKIQAK